MPRYGLLADVHANLPALDAVLAGLDAAGVDEVVVAGDLVGYGAQPDECVDRLRSVSATCVAGNHDRYVCDRLRPSGRLPAAAAVALDWTRQRLSPEVRAYLDALPEVTVVGDLVVAHGSLDDVEEYVVGEAAARRQLRAATAAHPDCRTLVLGHTHHQVLLGPGGTIPGRGGSVHPRPLAAHLLNPGSVGQSRQRERAPRARYAVLDSDRSTIAFHAVPYDVTAARRALAAAGLPAAAVQLTPSRRGQARRLVRRVVRPLRR